MDITKKEYWDNKYIIKQTGWDAGGITAPLKEYIDSLSEKNIKILIPGCGNAYEAEYLWNNGFHNVFLLDISEEAIKNFKNRMPHIPDNHLIIEDFFEHKGNYDLILEQTFFCAIPINSRNNYARKINELLNPNGILAGVLFDCFFEKEGPPFGGDSDEYMEYFSPYFEFIKFERCRNSIKPRAGRELFIILRKKSE